MRIINLMFTVFIAALLGSLSPVTQAAEGAIKVTSIAQTEIEATGKDGKKTRQRAPVATALPGTEVIYTTTFENTAKKPASGIVINNPVPNDSEYIGGSAFGKDCEILFSADGGKKFGHAEELKIKTEDGKLRTALPGEYTHIRWLYKKQLPPGKSGEAGFRAKVK